jgi:hypothetical protein
MKKLIILSVLGAVAVQVAKRYDITLEDVKNFLLPKLKAAV